jgi:hypothetical protein
MLGTTGPKAADLLTTEGLRYKGNVRGEILRRRRNSGASG